MFKRKYHLGVFVHYTVGRYTYGIVTGPLALFVFNMFAFFFTRPRSYAGVRVYNNRVRTCFFHLFGKKKTK